MCIGAAGPWYRSFVEYDGVRLWVCEVYAYCAPTGIEGWMRVCCSRVETGAMIDGDTDVDAVTAETIEGDAEDATEGEWATDGS